MDPQPHTRGILGAVVATSVVTSMLAAVVTVAVFGTMGTVQASPQATSPGASATAGLAPVQVNVSNAIVDVAAKARPAVVTISSSGRSLNIFGVSTTGIGSGFIFDSNGWILTNWHVVEGANSLTVTLEDGRQFSARVVNSDRGLDLAVVKVDATGLPMVQIGNSANLRVGQLVVAIGSPLGTFTDSVTSGILSATGRTITVQDRLTGQPRTIRNLLQTDAAINEGNSGGPLLDSSGRVIGINAAEASNAEGIGFAIPIDEAASIMTTARAQA